MASLEASAAAASVPFVIGSIAFNVGRSRLINPEHTHRWTVFVRGAHKCVQICAARTNVLGAEANGAKTSERRS